MAISCHQNWSKFSRRSVVFAPPQSADLCAIGSILHRVNVQSWRRPLHGRLSKIYVWGTGIKEDLPIRLPVFCNVVAVRGPYTLANVAGHKDIPLGDPGLLANLVPGTTALPKIHKLGIIPHYVDKDHQNLRYLGQAFPDAVTIDVTNPDVDVTTRQIASCDFIISSSLHGLIVADAFNIPRVRVGFTGRIKGGDFNFSDYFTTVKTKRIEVVDPLALKPGNLESFLETADAEAVNAIRSQLIRCFRSK